MGGAENTSDLEQSHDLVVCQCRVNAEQRQQQGLQTDAAHNALASGRGSG